MKKNDAQKLDKDSLTEAMKSGRTSITDPIRVDFLPPELEGRIGLTFAPGKKALPKFGARWVRDLALDLDRLVAEYRTDLLVCLLEDHELVRLGIEDLIEQSELRGIEVLRLPIPDGGVLPHPVDVADVVEEIIHAAEAGETVVIHCAGGLGRTGTIAGCALVTLGHTPDEAIEVLHQARGPRCPENRLQEAFIADFAEKIAVGRLPRRTP